MAGLEQEVRTAIKVPEGRDLTIYTRFMDAALKAKVESMLSRYGEIKDGAVILDIGSGTGKIAEQIARELHDLGVKVFAVDNSHDLLDIADANRSVIRLIYADATELAGVPDNSADFTMHGTIGHEINTFSGSDGLKDTLAATLRVLKPGGREVWRDFAKPEYEGQVLMKILDVDGTESLEAATKDGFLDYSLLSTRKLFEMFHSEFMGGNAFEYTIIQRDGQNYIQLPSRFAHEFCLHKDYTANWRQEIHEQYLYWTPTDAHTAFQEAGFVNISVEEDDQQYIRNTRLRGHIALYQDTEGPLTEVEFLTHMVVTAEKPLGADVEDAQEIPEVDYKALVQTIHVDEEAGIARIGDNEFKILNKVGTGSHKRGFVLEDGKHVIKIVRSDRVNLHGIFKSVQQMIDRQPILKEFGVPYMPITDKDPDGPPYRYVVQERIPSGSHSAAEMILHGDLVEEDVRQMATFINAFELSKRFQIDTNPYNWYRVTQPDGTTQMTYIGGTVFSYDEMWDFKRIGLIQWCIPGFIQGSEHWESIVPKATDVDSFAKNWHSLDTPVIQWWKKYLSVTVQPA
jgi:ubiquinone/menaquinone biosynthesis C-methylase UbiE